MKSPEAIISFATGLLPLVDLSGFRNKVQEEICSIIDRTVDWEEVFQVPKSIRARDLQERMDSPEGAVILDVRPESAFNEWRIQGKHLTAINIQNSKLKAFGVEHFSEIPKDRQVVAVCAKGISAQETVSILEQSGYQAVYLEGGMSGWSEFYRVACVVKRDDFAIYQLQRVAKGCLSYMITSGTEAAVIDAGRHIREYQALAEQLGVQIRFVFDTHLHADHVSGGRALADAVGASYRIAREEMAGGTVPYEPLEDGQMISFGRPGFSMQVICTPGHTPALMSFLIANEFLLAGDTVFVSGLGRPDLKGNAEKMAEYLYDTVFQRLSGLSDDVVILPGHFSDISELNQEGYVGARLGDIRKNNSLFQLTNQAVFVNEVVHRVGATPPNYQTVIQVNQGLETHDDASLAELEIGPNRCAVKNEMPVKNELR
jgi:glyoxylase-like metal-dependent hydrolase (beta-lactamase superfamily II)/rhodanese-related sulfurtransferase